MEGVAAAAALVLALLRPGPPGDNAPPATPAILVVDEARGVTLARLPVDPAAGDARLALHYVHSVYRQPAVEEMAVTPEGLRLVRLASPSAAVMEYYARPEPVLPAPDGYEIRIAPEGERAARRLELLVGAVGRRTVVYAGRELPLHELAGEGARVSVRVSEASGR